jgi:hypothetical protein
MQGLQLAALLPVGRDSCVQDWDIKLCVIIKTWPKQIQPMLTMILII